jgi:hypothetical protein
MSILLTLLMKFLVLPFILIIIPILLLIWLVLAYDDSTSPDLSKEKEGGDEGKE